MDDINNDIYLNRLEKHFFQALKLKGYSYNYINSFKKYENKYVKNIKEFFVDVLGINKDNINKENRNIFEDNKQLHYIYETFHTRLN